MLKKTIRRKYSYIGLPAKSQIYVLEYERLIRMFLSAMNKNKTFDRYIESNIKYFKRNIDRITVFDTFLDFLSAYKEDRVNFLIENKRLFSKSDTVRLIVYLDNNYKKYKNLLKKKDLTKEESFFIFNFRNTFSKEFLTFLDKNISDIRKQIWNLITNIFKFHQKMIIKYLMTNRKGIENPDDLMSDALNVVMMMLDNYNPFRSKVPFSSFLHFSIKTVKNQIIKEETETCSFEDINKYKDSIKNPSIDEYSYEDNNVFINEKIIFELMLLDVVKFLPKPLKESIILRYNLTTKNIF